MTTGPRLTPEKMAQLTSLLREAQEHHSLVVFRFDENEGRSKIRAMASPQAVLVCMAELAVMLMKEPELRPEIRDMLRLHQAAYLALALMNDEEEEGPGPNGPSEESPTRH